MIVCPARPTQSLKPEPIGEGHGYDRQCFSGLARVRTLRTKWRHNSVRGRPKKAVNVFGPVARHMRTTGERESDGV